MKMLSTGLLLLTLPLITACSSGKTGNGFYKGYETPDYKVIKNYGPVEIREYPQTIVAEVTVEGERKEAVGEGFKVLADYIFGGNKGGDKLAITSPVKQETVHFNDDGQTIDMTSPVTQSAAENGWKIQFTMPRKYTLESLPEPDNKRISLRKEAGKKMAVLIYSGWWSEDNFQQKKAELQTIITREKLATKGDVGAMYYDDPFTFPWNRRNEVMVEIQ